MSDLYKLAQETLVSSLLADGDNAIKVMEIISAKNIEEPELSLIFEAMSEVLRNDEKISIITVAEELEKSGNLKKVGGVSKLYELRSRGLDYILEAPVEIYAKVVKKASAQNNVKNILTESVDLVKEDSGVSVTDAVSQILSSLNDELNELSTNETMVELSKGYGDYIQLLKEREELSIFNQQNGNKLQGIPTSLKTLSELTTGWGAGQLITVGARTGIGKSIFAVNNAVSAASAGKTVLFFSLEMAKEELQDRIMASISSVSLNDLKQGIFSEHQKESIRKSADTIKNMNIIVETDPSVTIDSIRAKAIKQAQTKEGLDFVIIDYLQLITPVGRFGSRQEAVADISRNMKLLAKQLNVPVMVVVQLKREDKDSENPIPKIDDIRESGAIAQDSDIVILLHRDQTQDDTTPPTLFILAKQRQGPANKTIRCHSNLAFSNFTEMKKSSDIKQMTEEEHLEYADDDLDINDVDLDDLDFD